MLSLYRRHRPRTLRSRWSARSTSSARSATRSSSTRSITPTCSSARAGPARPSMAKLLACALNAEGGPRTEFDPERSGGARDPRRHLARRGRDGRRVEQLGGRHPRAARERGPRPDGGARSASTSSTRPTCSPPAAWNAFLKTLEEPPSHVVFVLATTEAHKVPATIVDRCHRFDFQPPLARADRRGARAGRDGGGHPAARRRRGHARPVGHRQLPRRSGHARAARDLRGRGGEARRRARHPRGGRRRAGARRGRGARRPRPEGRPARPSSASRTRAATSRSSCAISPPTCATSSWSRPSARCPTRSRSPPRAPSGCRRRRRASRRASSCARSTSSPPGSRRSRTARSRASSSRWPC